jgi:hypothetical protein
MRFSNSKHSRSSCRQQDSHRARLAVEPLEDRRMLAAFELSSLLEANGGDGTAGFVANGPTTGTGFTVSLSGDMNGDGYADFLVSDVDFDPFVNPGKPSGKYQRTEGAVFVVFGNEQGIPEVDLTSLDGTNGFAIYGNPEDGPLKFVGTGWGALAAGDLNGDGIDDAVIPTLRSTRAYVLYGKPQWAAVVELQSLTPSHGGDGSQGFVINGPIEGFARSITLDGDVNGDGRSDLVIGSDSMNNYDGGAIVIFGRGVSQPFPVEFPVNSLDGSNGVVIQGIDSGEYPSYSGSSVATGGDLNGDGVDDIVIGARRASPDAGRLEAGQVFVIYGSASLPGTIALSDILNGSGADGFVLNGIRGNTETGVVGDRAGVSVHSGGDFNGDGISDLAIGASRARNEAGAIEVGESYIVFGRGADEPPFPTVFELADLDGASGVTVRGFVQGDSFGKHVALVNFNGDAYADLVTTAPGGDPDGRTDAGEVFVVFGSPDTPVGRLIDLAGIIAGDGSAGLVIRGIDGGESVGGGISSVNDQGTTLGVGDFNGDGMDDLSLGNVRAVSRAYVVFGGAHIIPPPPAPSFSIDDVAVSEADSGTVTAMFTVTRAGDTSGTDTVDFTTADDTASAGSDYAFASGTLTFLPGVTSLPVNVIVQGDIVDEADETFLVQLTNASAGATIVDATGVGTIEDDDSAPNTLYVYDIRFESKRSGKDWRAVFEIRSDSNADGVGTSSDSPAAGVLMTVTFAGQTYTGVTDSSGVFRTNWIPNLSRGNHYAEVADLALAGFVWDPLGLDLENDSDNDGLPDQLLSVA